MANSQRIAYFSKDAGKSDAHNFQTAIMISFPSPSSSKFEPTTQAPTISMFKRPCLTIHPQPLPVNAVILTTNHPHVTAFPQRASLSIASSLLALRPAAAEHDVSVLPPVPVPQLASDPTSVTTRQRINFISPVLTPTHRHTKTKSAPRATRSPRELSNL